MYVCFSDYRERDDCTQEFEVESVSIEGGVMYNLTKKGPVVLATFIDGKWYTPTDDRYNDADGWKHVFLK